MTDKELTDEEIIKRLERCVNRGNLNYDTDIVLDLINRQKEEIKRLQKEVNLVSIQFQDLQERTDEKFRQWDMLAEKTKSHYANLYNEAKDKLKAEAYKEFAERVKQDINFPLAVQRVFDNLVKEMVGEEE